MMSISRLKTRFTALALALRYALVLALWSLVSLSLASHAQTADATDRLGRLFLTPAKRAQLEQQREYNLQEQQTLEGATVRLDGVVVRSNGKKTVWINGRAQNDNNNDFGIVTHVSPATPGQAALNDGGSGSTRLRVGQEINRATQEIHDGLGNGKVEVKPSVQKH